MTEKTIEYKSEEFSITADTNILEIKTKEGIKCTWTGQTIENDRNIKYSWEFDWDELKKEGIDELTGYIIAKRPTLTPAANIRINFHLTNSVQTIEATLVNAHWFPMPRVAFDYYLTPLRVLQTAEISYDVMFMASEQTDAVLVVDGKKMHVNKAFLSFHSDYFRALFSSNFKEGSMDEIPIQDVSHEDFARLLSIIYPQNEFPNDKTAEKLLELADRFMMPSVVRHVEYHLLNVSKLGNEKMLWMADKYDMPNLLEKSILQVNSAEKAKKIKKSPDYKNLSDKTKAALFDRLVMLV